MIIEFLETMIVLVYAIFLGVAFFMILGNVLKVLAHKIVFCRNCLRADEVSSDVFGKYIGKVTFCRRCRISDVFKVEDILSLKLKKLVKMRKV